MTRREANLIAVLMVLVLCTCAFGQAWDDADYALRKQVTVQDANVSSDLSNFPKAVIITADSDMAACESDLDDVRFYDHNGAALSYELVWHTGGGGAAVTAEFWVLVPNVYASPTGDRNKVWLYYDYPAATDGEAPAAVWANYAAVWHLQDLTDSTGNGNTLTASGSPTADVAATYGNGYQFAGSATLYRTDACGVSAYPVVQSGWFTTTDSSSSQTVVTFGDWSAVASIGVWGWNTPHDMLAHVYHSGGGAYAQATTSYVWDGSWQHACGVFTSNTSRAVYTDGAGKGTNATSKTFPSGQDRTSLAAVVYNSTTTRHLTGKLDEVRIRDANTANVTDAWVAFEYAEGSESDNELTWGSEETNSTNPPRAMYHYRTRRAQ